jgi:PAN domain
MQTEGEKQSDHRTAIIVAVLGLIGVLASPLIPRIWDTLFPSSRSPSIEAFAASSHKVTAGDSVRLRWRVKDADRVAINPGLTEGSLPGGSWEDRPRHTTLYTLTASTTAGATAQRSLTVEVMQGTSTPTPGAGGGASPPRLTIIAEFNIDRPNSTWDIESLNVGARDYKACDEPCFNRADCKSYVYYKPGVRGKDAVCVLKSELPMAVQNQPCCVTGVVKERALQQ